jgi:hypothetical protein
MPNFTVTLQLKVFNEMGLQEIRSLNIALNVLLCKTTLRVVQRVKKHTGFTQAFFTSTTSSVTIRNSADAAHIRALPALRRFSQNSRHKPPRCVQIYFFRIYSNSNVGVGRRVNMASVKRNYLRH